MRDDLPRIGVSTVWNAQRSPRLADALEELVALGIGLVEVAWSESPTDLAGAPAVLERNRARCHGLSLQQPEVERFLRPHLLQFDAELRQRAERQLERAIAAAARLRAPRVALRLGSIAVEFEEQRLDDLEQALARGDREGVTELGQALLVTRNRRRDAACEELVRRLHGLIRQQAGLKVVILPSGDPLSVPNLEECGWLLDDLGEALEVRLDLGELGLREALGLEAVDAWFDQFESRADAIQLCDYHGFKTDLPPGAGMLGEGLWARAMSPRVPTILKLDPASSRLTLEEAIRRLG